jgi:D-3-phosphoglycerate dehydrogenase / 2-oxoglutarate reductase
VDALEKNDLKAAGLDVLENENLSDLTSEELFIQQRLVKFENTVLSPHVGGWTTESFEKISRVLLQKIKELTLAQNSGKIKF